MNNGEKMKQKDALNILENNNNGVLSVCEANVPYNYPVCYDTDYFCGCVKIIIRAKKCCELVEKINNNNKVSLIVTGNNSNYNMWGFNCNNSKGITSVVAIGKAQIVEDEVDCCCPKDNCYVNIEIEVCDIKGRRNIVCM